MTTTTTMKTTMMTIMIVMVTVMAMVSQSLYGEKLAARRVTEPTFVSLLNGLPHFVRKCKNSWISRVGCVGDPSTRDMFSPET